VAAHWPLGFVWSAEPAPSASAIPLLSNEQAWKRLPRADTGAGQPLPVWARALADTLPATTAAMLELDYEHRSGGALPAQLRARLRWVVARTNQCPFGEACAVDDFVRAGGAPAALASRDRAVEGLPEVERAALAFAEKLTREANSVTDAEVARLVEAFGDKQVVAMVLLIAYANFLDRLALALDLPAAAAAVPPLAVRFAPTPLGAERQAPPRAAPLRPARLTDLLQPADAKWRALGFDSLQKGIADQHVRKPRLPLPAGQSAPIYWGLLCRTYQPRLADVWLACKQAYGAEVDQDRVFEASLFWVVTRTQRSFY
jgi:alkylhydroperoxidase family enzyme